MFGLWYALLSWKEYKTSTLATKRKNEQKPAEESNIKPEVPLVVPERVNNVDPNKNKSSLPSVPQALPQSIPKSIPQNTIIETSFPGQTQPSPNASLDLPPKPPRSPSPHPMRAEVFDDIEFDTEESDEEEEEEDEEEPNSVIDSAVIDTKKVATNNEDFLSGEINSLKRES